MRRHTDTIPTALHSDAIYSKCSDSRYRHVTRPERGRANTVTRGGTCQDSRPAVISSCPDRGASTSVRLSWHELRVDRQRPALNDDSTHPPYDETLVSGRPKSRHAA